MDGWMDEMRAYLSKCRQMAKMSLPAKHEHVACMLVHGAKNPAMEATAPSLPFLGAPHAICYRFSLAEARNQRFTAFELRAWR